MMSKGRRPRRRSGARAEGGVKASMTLDAEDDHARVSQRRRRRGGRGRGDDAAADKPHGRQVPAAAPAPEGEDFEADHDLVQHRTHQINYTQQQDAYQHLLRLHEADPSMSADFPISPDPRLRHSARSWDRQLRQWREQLEEYRSVGIPEQAGRRRYSLRFLLSLRDKAPSGRQPRDAPWARSPSPVGRGPVPRKGSADRSSKKELQKGPGWQTLWAAPGPEAAEAAKEEETAPALPDLVDIVEEDPPALADADELFPAAESSWVAEERAGIETTPSKPTQLNGVAVTPTQSVHAVSQKGSTPGDLSGAGESGAGGLVLGDITNFAQHQPTFSAVSPSSSVGPHGAAASPQLLGGMTPRGTCGGTPGTQRVIVVTERPNMYMQQQAQAPSYGALSSVHPPLDKAAALAQIRELQRQQARLLAQQEACRLASLRFQPLPNTCFEQPGYDQHGYDQNPGCYEHNGAHFYYE